MSLLKSIGNKKPLIVEWLFSILTLTLKNENVHTIQCKAMYKN